jgi:nitrogen fixation/metabolism regulation signal transduction histidine kinase
MLAFALIVVTSAVGYYLLNKVTGVPGSITWIIAAAAILVVIVFLPVVILVARKISYPLEVLAEGADEISRGNFGFTLDLSSNREINTLAQSFNGCQQS